MIVNPEVISDLRKRVVKIETQYGAGTGFLMVNSENWQGIATAAHVIGQAEQWRLPIRITTEDTKRSEYIEHGDRVIFADYKTDSAVILTFKTLFDLDVPAVVLAPPLKSLKVGYHVGWMGYPAVEHQVLCYFTGAISAFVSGRNDYLIDGVAINGVSGGPVIHDFSGNAVAIGVMTAYLPNQTISGVLPGLSRATDVMHFHEVIKNIRDYEDAQARKRDFDTPDNVPPPNQPSAGTAPITIGDPDGPS